MYVLYSTTLDLYIGRDQEGSLTLTPHRSRATQWHIYDNAYSALCDCVPSTHTLFEVKEY